MQMRLFPALIWMSGHPVGMVLATATLILLSLVLVATSVLG